MKTARFLITIMAIGSCALGLGHADEPSKPVPREDHKTSDHPADSAPGKQTPGKTEATEAKPSQPKVESHAPGKSSPAGPLNTQAKSTLGNKLSPPALNKPSPAAKAGFTMVGSMVNKTAAHPPAKFPVGSGATAPLAAPVRGRSDTPVSLGGSTTSSAKSLAGTLNGTAMKRKP